MFNPTTHTRLRLNAWVERDNYRVAADLDVPREKDLGIEDGHTMSLVMDPSRPTLLGWKPMPDRDDDPTFISGPVRTTNLPGHGQVRLTFSLESGDYELGTLIPREGSLYFTEVEVDSQSSTFWFPLPRGSAIHGMKEAFGFTNKLLDWLIWEVFEAKNSDASQLTFELDDDFVDDGSDELTLICTSNATNSMDWLRIPGELLGDPIRNGSEFLEYGFNPWNEEQKAQIGAHVEREISRLAELFQRDASVRGRCPLSTTV
jgi:hypothetical protein